MNKDKIKDIIGNINPKLKNPYFWLSFVALIFSASGVDIATLTSWSLFGTALLSIFNNPVSIIAVITALLGMWNNNSTKGMDKESIYSENHRDI